MIKSEGLCVWLAGTAALAMPLTAQAQVGAGPHRWAGAWGYATSPATRTVKGELPAGAYRFRMRLSRSGHGLRLTFSNPIGADPLHIASATVARAAEGFAIVPGSEATLGFDGGGAGTTITGGAVAFAQTAGFEAHGGEDVMVTVTTSAPSTTVAGAAAFPAAFAAEGAQDAAFQPQKVRPFVSLIAVGDPGSSCTIVTFGDSITEGARGTRPDWRGWPGELAQRLVATRSAHACGVVNMGISGNRLLTEGRGTAGIDRFDRDVASVPGATHLILLEGINDLWRSALPGEKPVTAVDLEDGYRRLIAAAHGRGMRVYGATLTPGNGSKYLTPAMEQIRQQVNQWIRSSGTFDGVIDFERAVADDASPPHLRPAFDSGDHLHPNDNGYRAMGQAISLALFASSKGQ